MPKKKKNEENNKNDDIDVIEIVGGEEKIRQYQDKMKNETEGGLAEVQDEEDSVLEIDEDELLRAEQALKDQEAIDDGLIDLEELKKEAEAGAEYKQHLQRLQAEFDNYRKRVIKEKELLRKVALEDFLQDIFPVLDSFDHALKAVPDGENLQSFLDGVHLIHKHFVEVLTKYGVSKIDALGEKFDPTFHFATLSEDTEDEDLHDCVLEEFQSGYRYGDKVIRPAIVKVGKYNK